VVFAMQEDGLIAPTTYYADLRLEPLIALARARLENKP
jgi:hypothetical protein